MDGWGQTRMLTTSGGANSIAGITDLSDEIQVGQQVSDQISIAPKSGTTSSGWYGVTVYAQSQVSRRVVRGVTLFDILVQALGASAAVWNGGEQGPTLYWNPATDDSVVAQSASLRLGASLAPGRSLRRSTSISRSVSVVIVALAPCLLAARHRGSPLARSSSSPNRSRHPSSIAASSASVSPSWP